jgi:hypothetical protein
MVEESLVFMVPTDYCLQGGCDEIGIGDILKEFTDTTRNFSKVNLDPAAFMVAGIVAEALKFHI